MKSGRLGPRLAAFTGALAVTFSMSVSGAAASDTFSLDNDSKTASLLGTSLWGEGNTVAASCRTGPFPGATETAFTFNPGDTGSLTLSQDPFGDCLSGINPLIDNSLEGPGITSGSWVWIPVDPLIGDAHLTCSTEAEQGSNLVTTSVDGLTCTFSDVGNSSVGSFQSSAAPVRNGMAVAYVQHFPGSKSKSGPAPDRAPYEVTLSTKGGKVLGRKKVTVVAGKPKRVPVPVSKAIRRQVAKKGSTKVKATISRVDGKPGKGDRATLSVVQDSPDLPF